jgi:hypothetical protein
LHGLVKGTSNAVKGIMAKPGLCQACLGPEALLAGHVEDNRQSRAFSFFGYTWHCAPPLLNTLNENGLRFLKEQVLCQICFKQAKLFI